MTEPAALPGWAADDHAAALSAYAVTADLLRPGWPRPDGSDPRRFFENQFRTAPPAGEALLTGYYEPELYGAAERGAAYRFPLYAPPEDLPADRLWFSRDEIEDGDLLAGRELIWLDSALEAFLAQVQGAVRVRLTDGSVRRFGFAAKNGHPYTSIGKELIRQGALSEDNASIAAIRDWAAEHPDELRGLLRLNRSFVFFRPLDIPAHLGPLGTMQRPVTALRSLAVDPGHIPLGAPVWVEWQGKSRLMIAQDTGGAIKGHGRGDIFFGTGEEAGRLAGALKTVGRLTVLLPKAGEP